MKSDNRVYEKSNKSPMLTVSAGLLDPKHIRAMGTAVWEYLVLLDWQTSADGSVRGGYRVAARDLSKRTGHSLDTTYRNLSHLENRNYIKREGVATSGWKITIHKPKKWFSKRRKNATGQPQEREPDSQICDRSSRKCDSSNKKVRIQTHTGESGGETTPPAYRCSHGDCPHPTYHAGRTVAEAQGLNFPDDIGSLPQWLKESKALTKFTDSDITEFVEFKIRRESNVRTKPNGHDETSFWISDRERDRRRRASEEGQAA